MKTCLWKGWPISFSHSYTYKRPQLGGTLKENILQKFIEWFKKVRFIATPFVNQMRVRFLREPQDLVVLNGCKFDKLPKNYIEDKERIR